MLRRPPVHLASASYLALGGLSQLIRSSP